MIKFIIKFASEVTIKTKPVRKRFTLRLSVNIEKVLRQHNHTADVVKRWDMIEVVLAPRHHENSEAFAARGHEVAALLANIPGISHFMQVEEYPVLQRSEPEDVASGELNNERQKSSQLQQIAECVENLRATSLAGQTFVVRCKRVGEHVFTSHDVERYVGAHLLRVSDAAGVKLKGADQTVAIEIKNDRLFVVVSRTEGLGGYPLGTVGPVLSLISGGYDSSVASFDMIRRGMETHYLFFNLGGHAHEVGVKQVSHYLWQRYGCSHRTAFVSVPFERVVEEILTKVANPLMGVVLKRMMVRAASQVAQQMNIQAIVTGECVSQVSSQTLQNLSVIEEACNALVLRPLIACDKTDIMARAANIGVAEFADVMPEYCAVISDKPSTAADLNKVKLEEESFDFTVLQHAIESRVLSGIDTVYEGTELLGDVPLQATPHPGQVVIDLRGDQEREDRPLILHSNELLVIPAYRVNRQFTELDAAKNYLLYCDKGVVSRLHAAHLKAEGFDNIGVYEPK